jgi:glycylpeptide N-tetradecanoyltransferase
MPAEESKPVDPAVVAEAAKVLAEASETSQGKQPEVESDDDDATEDVPAGSSAAADPGAAKKKKKSKRKKIKEVFSGKSAADESGKDVKKAIGSLSNEQVQELLNLNPALAQELAGSSDKDASEALKKLKLEDILTGLAASGKNVKDMASYKFWGTQPVPKFGDFEGRVEEGPLRVQKVEDVPKEPPTMIAGFEWVTMDLENDDEMKEVYELLNGHYVEDDEAMFRFNYSPSLLKW